MGTKAYFMIDAVDEVCREGRWVEAKRDLETIPEVEAVEAITGSCDFMVKVDAPIRAIFVANKIMAREWVKRVRILRIEPVEPEKPTLSELMAKRRETPTIKELVKTRANGSLGRRQARKRKDYPCQTCP
ncbi:hypothetical protein ES703_06010 [subsurface metagenome]